MAQSSDLHGALRDIRRLIVNRTDQSWILQRRWPFYDKKDFADHSGIHCLTVVIRRLYSVLDKAGRDVFKASENENAIFRYAWSVFDEITAKDKADQVAKSSEVLELLRQQTQKTGLSFKELAESDLMIQTCWKSPYFNLYQPVFYKHKDEPRWEMMPDDNNADMGIISLVKWNANETTNISEAIEASFGTSLDDHETETMFASRCPALIRVLFIPPTEEQQLSFDTCKKASVQKVKIQRITAPGTKDMMKIRYKDGNMCSYHLVAAVRLRASPQEPDFVRIYTMDGVHIEPGVPPRQYQSGDWKIEDQDHELMLYYIRADDEVPESNVRYPEVPGQRPDAKGVAQVQEMIEQRFKALTTKDDSDDKAPPQGPKRPLPTEPAEKERPHTPKRPRTHQTFSVPPEPSQLPIENTDRQPRNPNPNPSGTQPTSLIETTTERSSNEDQQVARFFSMATCQVIPRQGETESLGEDRRDQGTQESPAPVGGGRGRSGRRGRPPRSQRGQQAGRGRGRSGHRGGYQGCY